MKKCLLGLLLCVSATCLTGESTEAGGLFGGGGFDVGNAVKQLDPTNRNSEVSHITGSVVDTNKFRIFNPPPPPQGSSFNDPVYEGPPEIKYIPDGEDIFIKNKTGVRASFHVWAIPRGGQHWVKLKAQTLNDDGVALWTVPWKDGVVTTKDQQNQMHYAVYIESWTLDERQRIDFWTRPHGMPAQRVGFRTHPTQQPNVFMRRPWVEMDLSR